MKDILSEERFGFISGADKAFLVAFNDEMSLLGYDFGGAIGGGHCWGRYMVIYRKSGVSSERVFARVYIRDTDILLRLFLNDVDRHRDFVEKAPAHIKEVFVGHHGDCEHCHNEKDGACRFRKTYTIDGRFIEKCNGIVFEFRNPSVQRLPDYIALFTEFYPRRKVARQK